MTVHLALFLSSEGIALAHRQRAGHWTFLGDTSFDAPDLDKAMARLRKLGAEREGKEFPTLLVLPDDQILYTSLTAPTDDPEMTDYRIEEGLDGLTPYAVSELLYDWRAISADRVKLAVVARETLDEARAFAESHGFHPAGFAAMPPLERFPGVPLFDLAPEAHGLSFPEEGIAFGPDEWTDTPEEDATPGDSAKEDAKKPGETLSETANAGDEATGAAAADDDTDKTATEDEAGAPEAAEGATEPDAIASDSAPSDADKVGKSKKKTKTSKSEPAASGSSATDENAEADTTVPPRDVAEDTATSDDADEPDAAQAPDASPPTEEAADTGHHAADPLAESEAEAADRDPEEIIAATAEDEDELHGPAAPISQAAPAPREPDEPPPIEDPVFTGPVKPIDESESAGDELPPAPSSAVLAARHASASFDNDVSPPAFSARGDRLPARDDASEPFDAPPAQEAGKTVESTTETDEDSEARSARNALAERLSRVRDASRATTASPRDKGEETARLPGGKTARPVVPPVRGKAVPAGKAEAPRRGRLTGLTAKPAPGGDEGPTMVGPPSGEVPEGGRLGGILSFSRWGSRGAETEASAGGKQAMSGSGRLTALGAALRNDEAESAARDAPGVATDAAPDTEAQQDQNITGGLLGRKAERQTTPSYRTGLLLTVILLILLAAIAVWSALFLPDSPVARLFGDGEDVAANEPLDAPGPPEAITAPPAIGELTGADTLPTPPEEAASGEPEAADEAAADGADLAAVAPVDADPEPAAPPPEAATASEATATEPAPLPPLPADDLPSLEETRAAYEEYGIWQRPPDRPDVAPLETSVDLTVAAADQAVSSIDAVSLPAPQVAPDETFPRIQPPPPFGERPRATADGLVEPTPDGVVTPDGVLVIAGSPPRAAIPRPREEDLPAPAPSFSIEDAILGTFRPAQRPDDLGSVAAPPLPGATTDTARAGLEPQPNPVAAVTSVAAASLVPLDTDTTVEAPAPDLSDASRLAVARSIVPASRPDDIDSIIATASARPSPEPPPTAVEPAAVAPAPSIPSNADVARAATQNNELRLRDINLIGVTGTPSDRRALIRLPSGRFVRVGVGDRLDGGRVAAIGETTLQYVRNGRTLTLDIPG